MIIQEEGQNPTIYRIIGGRGEGRTTKAWEIAGDNADYYDFAQRQKGVPRGVNLTRNVILDNLDFAREQDNELFTASISFRGFHIMGAKVVVVTECDHKDDDGICWSRRAACCSKCAYTFPDGYYRRNAQLDALEQEAEKTKFPYAVGDELMLEIDPNGAWRKVSIAVVHDDLEIVIIRNLWKEVDGVPPTYQSLPTDIALKRLRQPVFYIGEYPFFHHSENGVEGYLCIFGYTYDKMTQVTLRNNGQGGSWSIELGENGKLATTVFRQLWGRETAMTAAEDLLKLLAHYNHKDYSPQKAKPFVDRFDRR